MKNQAAQQTLPQTQDQVDGPFEMDVRLLARVSGGFPKGTWLVENAMASVDILEPPAPTSAC